MCTVYGTEERPQDESQLNVSPYKAIVRKGVSVCEAHFVVAQQQLFSGPPRAGPGAAPMGNNLSCPPSRTDRLEIFALNRKD